MFKALIYKEWIKTRWPLLGFLFTGLVTIGVIIIKVHHDLSFFGEKNYWNSIIFQNLEYFSAFKYVPLIGGVTVGLTQYWPETVDKRIKLTFHLPVDEDKILLQMMAYGTLTLSLVFLGLFSFFIGLSHLFFPQEIINNAIITILPWFLSGYAAYYLIALIILEPVWKYRILYTIISVFYITFYLEKAIQGAYAPLIIQLTIFTMILSISLLFSGYRIRKGEQ